MFFTREDILKIQAELTRLGVKDSEFRDAHTPLDNNDTLVLSQGGRNVKIRIQDFLEQLHLLSSDDFINVTTKFDAHHLSLQEAIQVLPSKVRKIGLTITFQNIEGNWEIWQFTSNNIHQFNESSAWENCKVSVDSIAIPDEEDLTMITQGTRQVTKFKDKAYDPASFSGMGRVYLRKNVTKVQDPNTRETKTVNLLTQKMLGKENTIYVIQYDYNLNGQTINVPENCILKFEGGSLSNGTITGNNTSIVAGLTKVFSTNTILNGIWNVGEAYPEWFGAKSNDSAFDNAPSINACINNTPFTNVVLQAGCEYEIYSTILVKGQNFCFGTSVDMPIYNNFTKSAGAWIIAHGDLIALQVQGDAQSLILRGLCIYNRWAYRFGGVGIQFEENSSINSCIFKGIKIAYFNVGLRAIFRDGYKGISLCHFYDCSFVSCLLGMGLYYYDFSAQDKKWWMNLNHFDNCHWSFNAYGGLNITGVDSFEQNLFTACGFEGNGSNLGQEGWASYEANTDKDIYGLRIISNTGYGISTLDNCYFEINLSRGTSNEQTINETNNLENRTAGWQSDIQISGAQLELRNCTFNYGMSPIIHFGNRPLRLTINNCDFKNEQTNSYKSNNILLVRNASLSSTGEKNYVALYLPNLFSGNQPENAGYWSEKPIKCINVTGLTYCKFIYETPKISVRKNTYDYTTRELSTFKIEDNDVNVVNYKKWGDTASRPIIEIGGGTSLYGFQYFDTTLNKPIWWTGSKWVDSTGADI